MEFLTPAGTVVRSVLISVVAFACATSAEELPVERASEAPAKRALLNYKFTNELGQAASISDFRGQALAITFFFTRCPVPEFCPRLSRNFQEASKKLCADRDAPTNWHFLSVTFDPAFDTAEVLKEYALRYQYDPNHWSFLTGPPDKIAELARGSGIKAERDGALINHNFRTLIIDASGKLQTAFPTGGDLSDAIVQEIRKAVGVTQKESQARALLDNATAR